MTWFNLQRCQRHDFYARILVWLVWHDGQTGSGGWIEVGGWWDCIGWIAATELSMVKHEWANGVEVNTSTLVIICFSPTLLIIIAQRSLCRLSIFKILRSTKELLQAFFYDIFLLVKISNFGNLVCQHCSALASIGLKIGLEVNRINCCSRKVIFIFFPRKWFQSSQTEQRKKIKGQLKIRKWCWCQISPKVQDILMIRCHLELGGGKNCHLKCETFNLKFKRKFASYLPKESPFHSVEKAFKFQMLKLTPIHSLVIEIFPHNFQIHCGSNSIQFVLIL